MSERLFWIIAAALAVLSASAQDRDFDYYLTVDPKRCTPMNAQGEITCTYDIQ